MPDGSSDKIQRAYAFLLAAAMWIGLGPWISHVCTFPTSARWAARIIEGTEGFLVGAIVQCRGHCAHISAVLRFWAVGLVDSKSMEDVSGSDAVESLHEGWDRSEE